MLYDEFKCYPYPVLRPGSSDYFDAEFQVDIRLEKEVNSTALRVGASFELSDPGLVDAIGEQLAKYVLHISSPSTRFRTAIESRVNRIERVFESGALAGRISVRGLLVAAKDLENFCLDSWNECYMDQTFGICVGSVLAEDLPKEYWVDSAEEAPIGSIFKIGESDDVDNGTWACLLSHHKIMLQLSKMDFRRLQLARMRVKGTADLAYILNAIYLPALIYTLEQGDRGVDDFQSYRWFHSLNSKLEDSDLDLLGNGRQRLNDAQALLERPFGKLPIVNSVE